ncbi:hypothetical protein CTI12_AA171050 [Artemisia annua]|uniref:Reverse transcriptase domain-containing protein n=1 Tax=Artemisia annua TaxID=35608 RepID=A0A2U1PBI0_ARTAN|nr:hypothetical protein CTI12_AA171050 [Artemisia annua]
MTSGTLSGIKMARSCPLISHIFFADDPLFFLKASHGECRALVNILNSYCQASGQTVNFEKSSAFFLPNTPSSLRNDICSTLQVHQMDSNAKYLGLPSIFGQQKTELFGFLLDKVLQKLQGWKQKVLSQAVAAKLFCELNYKATSSSMWGLNTIPSVSDSLAPSSSAIFNRLSVTPNHHDGHHSTVTGHGNW